jgi:hypothetical protein
MSSIITRSTGEKLLRETITAWVGRGTDPRGFRKTLAKSFDVPVETVDAAITELAPAGCEDARRHEDWCNSAENFRQVATTDRSHDEA